MSCTVTSEVCLAKQANCQQFSTGVGGRLMYYFYHFVCKPIVDCFPLVLEGGFGCMISICVSTAEVMSSTCNFKSKKQEKHMRLAM